MFQWNPKFFWGISQREICDAVFDGIERIFQQFEEPNFICLNPFSPLTKLLRSYFKKSNKERCSSILPQILNQSLHYWQNKHRILNS